VTVVTGCVYTYNVSEVFREESQQTYDHQNNYIGGTFHNVDQPHCCFIQGFGIRASSSTLGDMICDNVPFS